MVDSSKLLLWRIYTWLRKKLNVLLRIFHPSFLFLSFFFFNFEFAAFGVFFLFSSPRLLSIYVSVIRDLRVTWWWGTSSWSILGSMCVWYTLRSTQFRLQQTWLSEVCLLILVNSTCHVIELFIEVSHVFILGWCFLGWWSELYHRQCCKLQT